MNTGFEDQQFFQFFRRWKKDFLVVGFVQISRALGLTDMSGA
jgi:hypothetical protein